jgi:hypothetical protein
MANGYLGQLLQGVTGGDAYLRDYRHAEKIFRSNSYALAPKLKFSFHTVFNINPKVYDPGASPLVNVLVKTIRLPSFSIKTQEYNQYNRKRLIQTKINYESINVTLHDDNSNNVSKLWQAYYAYYYKDSTNLKALGVNGSSGQGQSAQSSSTRNLYNTDLSGQNNWGYTGEMFTTNSTSKPAFFNDITVFGFSRHQFTAYTLINPIITKFDHDTYNYSEGGGTMECKMDISYETVVYREGNIDGRTPDKIAAGFGSTATYDKNLSPITPIGANSPVPGTTGYVDSAGGNTKLLVDADPALIAKWDGII